MCMYVCILAYNSGTGRAIASKFSGYCEVVVLKNF